MSDVDDSNGKPSEHGHWQGGRKSKTDSAKVPSVLLALTGVAIVAIQVSLYTTILYIYAQCWRSNQSSTSLFCFLLSFLHTHTHVDVHFHRFRRRR